MKTPLFVKKSVYSALVFFGTLSVLSMGYAAYSLATETSGASLTAGKWNAIIDAVNDADSRISEVTSSVASLSGALSSLQAVAGGIWNVGADSSINYTAGNVGIGTANPGVKLEVAGQVKITGGSPGAGKILTSDASGTANWQTPAAAGKVLQVGYAAKTDSWSAATVGNNFYTVPGLSVTLTPSSTASKVLLTLSLYGGTTNYQIKFRILRNGTPVILGSGEGGRPITTGAIIPYDPNAATQQYQLSFLGGTYMDTPSTTSPVTYAVQMAAYDNQTVYLNRSATWQNGAVQWYDASPVSTITAMEVGN